MLYTFLIYSINEKWWVLLPTLLAMLRFGEADIIKTILRGIEEPETLKELLK
jgi:hypothetical protein